MNKIKLFIAIISCCFCFNTQLEAQSFWKKLSKSVEKVSKEVDKAIATDTGSGDTSATPSGITITTPHKDLSLELVNTELSGEYFVLELLLTNKNEDIKDYRLAGCFGGCGASKAYDNLGNECRVDIIFGKSESWHGGEAGNSLLKDTPTKVKVLLSGFSSKATSFTQVRTYGYAYASSYKPDGNFIIKNVPIIKPQTSTTSVSNESKNDGK